MAIDREKALGAVIPGGEGHYGKDDVILYHLGIGAGNPPTDPGELSPVRRRVAWLTLGLFALLFMPVWMREVFV